MRIEEYNLGVKKIDEGAIKAKSALAKEYANANNPYKIGDVIKDHICSIRIEKIGYIIGSYSRLPECIYNGVVLLKGGAENKKGQRTDVYQSNIEL